MSPDRIPTAVPALLRAGTTTRPEGTTAMYMLEHELARTRMTEMQVQAQAATRAHS